MKICNTPFEDESNEELNALFNLFKFSLSNFQKWAIFGLLNNKNVLITAHTGSGKTVPAEAAIKHFVGKGKYVFYTSPIKALTNQKFNEFSKKFPKISFGIITGDNKYNPEAQVLLMTAEILRNTLFRKKMLSHGTGDGSLLSFDINLDDIGCVIMDEAHYINDKDRGRVWEETIMMLPKNIQMLLLSATLNKPEERLIPLIESRGGPEVLICPTSKREVPLNHYSWITAPKSIFKKMSNSNKKKHESNFNKLLLIKGPTTNEKFEDIQYQRIKSTLDFMEKTRIKVNKYFVINELIVMLKSNGLLPAIVFVFSRKQVDILANKVQLMLYEDGSKKSSTVDKECEKLLKSKLTNWKEYTMLPEYEALINLLRKGIGVHHAGILKEFREMIELLFDKGYIKLLFATETFAVGINMPTKTTVFTSLEKFDGNSFRYLEPSEYTQMAGRAGRRGIDTKGVVIHLNNLFSRNEIAVNDYKHILTGPPKSVVSQFSINPTLILQLISTGNLDFNTFISKSMISKDIHNSKNTAMTNMRKLKEEYNCVDITTLYKTDIETLDRLYIIDDKKQRKKGAERKTIIREYNDLIKKTNFVETDYMKFCQRKTQYYNIQKLETEFYRIDTYIIRMCDRQIKLLKQNEFINADSELTQKGIYATYIQEIFSFPIAELMHSEWLSNIDTKNIVGVLSCFANMRLSDEHSVLAVESIDAHPDTKKEIKRLITSYNKYIDIFDREVITLIDHPEIQLNLCELTIKWCECNDENMCKKIIESCRYYGIGLGDFVKSILKINNISKELENIAILSENLNLLGKLKEIPDLTLKFCVSNQSLYL